jgi:hypothetical protein
MRVLAKVNSQQSMNRQKGQSKGRRGVASPLRRRPQTMMATARGGGDCAVVAMTDDCCH